jgi:hypothetical protein
MPIPFAKWLTRGARAGDEPEPPAPPDFAALLAQFPQQFADAARSPSTFRAAEQAGIHLLPVHFYSPAPDVREIPESQWAARVCQLPGAPGDYTPLLAAIGPYCEEMRGVPETAEPHVFHWKNPALYWGDAVLYYSLIRHLKPRRIIEVGAGYTTLIARLAARKQTLRLEAIEPFPFEWLAAVTDELTATPVQNVPLDRFRSLAPGDFLFIDSTHISKTASDVNYLFLHVLPALAPGVVVHVHDIYLPYEYPRSWVVEKQIFYNEQYLLAAMLTGASQWEILIPYFWLATDAPEALTSAFPFVDPPGGGSFWMRKRPAR